ncbi:acyl-CoA dehydrogenase C-terminal domain-containing protein [Rhodovibrionaceae bacterium A322]
MVSYKAPLDDIRFALHEMNDYNGKVATLPGYEDATPDLLDAVLEEAARFCEQELLPLNQTGDQEGCQFENGVVRTPSGFKEAYDKFVEGGWNGLAASPDFGGQGLPKTLHFVLEEIICSTNLSFGTYPGLTFGAYKAIENWGSEELKAKYLEKMVAGNWSGTMCLTEPHCGTDLGLIRTKALPQDDGSYRITGTKIFITGGEQDLTENIIHLVLAKLPDAPAGSKGISLFLVPKYLVKEDGSLGARNGAACGSIEHKMGIKASATCVMNFEDAEGYLVGVPHGGMKAMFTMMNNARLGVGLQGLGLAETSYQNAVIYAKDRLQGRSLSGVKAAGKPADPIIVHPDVRRNLLGLKAVNEACRSLAVEVGMAIDRADNHPDKAARQEADDYVQLMTPIIKAFYTDHGFSGTNSGMQVFGGHGYIAEWGMEQLVRDARIAQLYEGANGIQALDLVGRKLGVGMGRLLRRFFHPVQDFLEANVDEVELEEFVLPLAKAFSRLQQATGQIAQKGMADAEEAGAAATDYLNLFALVALAYHWARAAQIAQHRLEGAEGMEPTDLGDDFYRVKLETARFYMTKVLPESSALFARIMSGKNTLMALEADDF